MSQSRGIRDVHADDNGSWTPSSPRRSYSIVKESDDIVSVKLFLQSLESRSLSVDSMGFIKEHLDSEVISTVRDSKGELVPKAILHYFFPVGKKVFLFIFLFMAILHKPPSNHITEHNRVHLMS